MILQVLAYGRMTHMKWEDSICCFDANYKHVWSTATWHETIRDTLSILTEVGCPKTWFLYVLGLLARSVRQDRLNNTFPYCECVDNWVHKKVQMMILMGKIWARDVSAVQRYLILRRTCVSWAPSQLSQVYRSYLQWSPQKTSGGWVSPQKIKQWLKRGTPGNMYKISSITT